MCALLAELKILRTRLFSLRFSIKQPETSVAIQVCEDHADAQQCKDMYSEGPKIGLQAT